jgi:hypothetical protein
MARSRVFLFLGAAALTVAGCGRQSADGRPPVRQGTAALMGQVARAPEYKPPADGRLDRRQVEMFLAVHRREQTIRDAMKAAGDLANPAIADLRAARELGYNPREYAWVRDRVLEAEMLRTTRTLSRQVAESRRALLAMLRKQRETADAGRRAEIDHQIRELETPSGAAGADPARESNADLLAQVSGGAQERGGSQDVRR